MVNIVTNLWIPKKRQEIYAFPEWPLFYQGLCCKVLVNKKKNKMAIKPGVHTFYKNTGAISNF